VIILRRTAGNPQGEAIGPPVFTCFVSHSTMCFGHSLGLLVQGNVVSAERALRSNSLRKARSLFFGPVRILRGSSLNSSSLS